MFIKMTSSRCPKCKSEDNSADYDFKRLNVKPTRFKCNECGFNSNELEKWVDNAKTNV